jgi:GcrA cell cycle regulator
MWNETNTAEFVRLYDEGHPHSVIGAKLGCSRNASIGKAHRMGLEKRVPTPRPQVRRPRIQKIRKMAKILFGEGGMIKPFREFMPMPELCPRPVNSRPPGPLEASECIASGECGCNLNGDAASAGLLHVGAHQEAGSPTRPLPASNPCTLMDLTSQTCRWPLWSDARPERLFCGAIPAKGLPYCCAHSAIAYTGRRG